MKMFEDQTEEIKQALNLNQAESTFTKLEIIRKIRARKVLTENYVKENGTIRRAIPKVRGKKARKIEKILRHNAKFDLEHKRKNNDNSESNNNDNI